MSEQERIDKELARHEADTVMQRRLEAASMAMSENQKLRDRIAQLEAERDEIKEVLSDADSSDLWDRGELIGWICAIEGIVNKYAALSEQEEGK